MHTFTETCCRDRTLDLKESKNTIPYEPYSPSFGARRRTGSIDALSSPHTSDEKLNEGETLQFAL
jgi:hypothetical protein